MTSCEGLVSLCFGMLRLRLSISRPWEGEPGISAGSHLRGISLLDREQDGADVPDEGGRGRRHQGLAWKATFEYCHEVEMSCWQLKVSVNESGLMDMKRHEECM